jgi:hypothetical protein
MTTPPGFTPEVQDRLVACVDLIGRTGATDFQIRYSDDEQPVVWIAVAKYRRRAGRDEPTLTRHETAAALRPDQAAFRLVEALVDGGQCQHCRKPTGVLDDWSQEPPLAALGVVCWYTYDPELKTYRRGCE